MKTKVDFDTLYDSCMKYIKLKFSEDQKRGWEFLFGYFSRHIHENTLPFTITGGLSGFYKYVNNKG